MARLTNLILMAFTVPLLAGCASITSHPRHDARVGDAGNGMVDDVVNSSYAVRQPTKDILIDSSPRGARAIITDQDGKHVATVITPARVALNRGYAGYRSASYQVVIEKPGYHRAQTTIGGSFNWWTLANGLYLPLSFISTLGPGIAVIPPVVAAVGAGVVDPMTGGAFNLSAADPAPQLSRAHGDGPHVAKPLVYMPNR